MSYTKCRKLEEKQCCRCAQDLQVWNNKLMEQHRQHLMMRVYSEKKLIIIFSNQIEKVIRNAWLGLSVAANHWQSNNFLCLQWLYGCRFAAAAVVQYLKCDNWAIATARRHGNEITHVVAAHAPAWAASDSDSRALQRSVTAITAISGRLTRDREDTR